MSSCRLLTLLFFGLAAAGPVVGPPGRMTGYVRLGFGYDSNVFRYSAEDLRAFRLGEDPARFPIRTADDLAVTLSTGLDYRCGGLGRDGSIGLRARLSQYASNWDRSHGLVAVSTTQPLWPGGHTLVGMTWMPDYLIRYYPDPEREGYTACRFAEYLPAVTIEQRLGSFTFGATYRWEVDDYLPPFDYYDTRAHRLGAAAAWRRARAFEVAVDYQYKLARAEGPVPDISYDEHGVEVRVASRPRSHDRLAVEVGYGLGLRRFTTGNSGELDPSHAGRRDRIEHADLEGSYRFGAARLVAAYRFEWREVSSPYSGHIVDIKEYRRSCLDLGVVVGLSRLWEGGLR